MSTNFHVYLATQSLPSPSKWQAEITKMNSSLIMDTDINLVTFSGFLPFQFNQEITGFEYCSWFIDHEEKQEVNIPSADFCMCFSIGNNPLELTITVISIYCLIKLTDGVLFDPQKGIYIEPSNIFTWKKEMLT